MRKKALALGAAGILGLVGMHYGIIFSNAATNDYNSFAMAYMESPLIDAKPGAGGSANMSADLEEPVMRKASVSFDDGRDALLRSNNIDLAEPANNRVTKHLLPETEGEFNSPLIRFSNYFVHSYVFPTNQFRNHTSGGYVIEDARFDNVYVDSPDITRPQVAMFRTKATDPAQAARMSIRETEKSLGLEPSGAGTELDARNHVLVINDESGKNIGTVMHAISGNSFTKYVVLNPRVHGAKANAIMMASKSTAIDRS